MLIFFWLSQTWDVTLTIKQEVFSGCTMLLDCKETKLGSSDKEASPWAGKNNRLVLCRFSYFQWCGYSWVPWVSFFMTEFTDYLFDFYLFYDSMKWSYIKNGVSYASKIEVIFVFLYEIYFLHHFYFKGCVHYSFTNLFFMPKR